MPEPLRVVFVDNFDSFTWNLVDEFARRGIAVEVWRNTAPAKLVLARARQDGPGLLVLSPGPGTPAEAGSCIELVRLAAPAGVPVFGVCLGHQAMVEAFGGTVGPAGEVVHGKTSRVRHEGGPLFEGVPSPFPVGRYHSLAATRLPECLKPIAGTDRVVMAVEHRSAPQLGVQFHPESILTPEGGRIIDNVLRWAADACR
ncbi:MAG TPA: aminodeoxychorismate/anthranilate synthase component II [Gemmatimonadales bacterium]|nr:aminodeoxychorismate/anthranilate synthase component II [Gemmatimonadales bacterium]